MTKLCVYRTFAGNLEQPPEYCERDAIPFSDYCQWHLFEDADAMFDDVEEDWPFQ